MMIYIAKDAGEATDYGRQLQIYHNFISKARDAMKKHNSEGIGLLVDFHGHAHSHEKIEIGYLFK